MAAVHNEQLEQKLGFDRIRAAISDKCSTDYAVQRTAREEFSSDPREIRRRLLLADEMRLVLMFEESFPSTGFIDCLDFLIPLENPNVHIDLVSLRKLRTMLGTLGKVLAFFASVKDSVYPNLKRMSSSVASFPVPLKKIDSVLDRYGEIKDTASDQLYQIRKEIQAKESSISRRVAAILQKAQQDGIVDADASVTIRDGKMLIPVSAASKHRLQGYIYDESASGKTAFIEPFEAVALDNEIKELHFAEQREILRILVELSDFLRPYIPDLRGASVFLGELDFIMAKAQVALDIIAGMPVISEEGELSLRKARHPLLEKALKKEKREMVPLTVNLNPQKRILLISGPNAGGKSVCLKTVGLLQYMFQWGMLIPVSESSSLMVYDRIMVDIGDDQSLESDLSTYSSFLSNMKEVLERSDEKTLVLIDEFGSGTEPAAGGAIAEAILARLDERGAYGVLTTHYTNLKLYASRGDTHVCNGAMQFDSRNIAPLFKLEMGLPGNSFAFELARKMGLPEDIVKDAETRAGEEFVDIERNLRKIARSRLAIDARLEHIRSTDKTLESITEKYQKELTDIRQQKKEIIDEATAEAERIVQEANRKVENTIRTIKESQADKDTTREARAELRDFVSAFARDRAQREKEKDEYIDRKIRQLDARRERQAQRRAEKSAKASSDEALREKAARERETEFRSAPLKEGEKVRLKSNGMVGEVIRVSSKTLIVSIGDITTKITPDKVERITSNEFRTAVKATVRPVAAAAVDPSITRRKLEFSPELDVRGERVNDAIDKVMRFVDDAIMLGMSSVRIIHGKGTGALREEIQKFLKTTPGIASISDEHIQMGGTGVTIVTFE
ncbi:MAG: Smr/MutS family protein [Bacteroidales bacterium]|nr:Smr/MutS family protein [Bacteroidales bacterium]